MADQLTPDERFDFTRLAQTVSDGVSLDNPGLLELRRLAQKNALANPSDDSAQGWLAEAERLTAERGITPPPSSTPPPPSMTLPPPPATTRPPASASSAPGEPQKTSWTRPGTWSLLRKLGVGVGAAFIGLLILGTIAGDDDPADDAALPTTTSITTEASPPSSVEPTPTSAPTTTPGSTTTTELLEDILLSGIYLVGTDIEPGLYRVFGYWARLDSDQEIIDNELIGDEGSGLMLVQESDAFIEITGEAFDMDVWSNRVDPVGRSYTSGSYRVPEDLSAGLYRVSPPDGELAYAARLTPGSREVIDNVLSEGQVLLEAREGEWFEFSGGVLEIVQG